MTDAADVLTARELATLRALADGRTYAEIARATDRQPGTVKDRVGLIREKLGATTTAGAIAAGFRRGLLA